MGSLLRRAIGSRFGAVGFQEASPCAMVRIGRWALRRINSQSVGLPCPRFTEGQEFIVEYGRQRHRHPASPAPRPAKLTWAA